MFFRRIRNAISISLKSSLGSMTPRLTIDTCSVCFPFLQITRLKIDSNPFAKGFRDSSRLIPVERCVHFAYYSSPGFYFESKFEIVSYQACSAGIFITGRQQRKRKKKGKEKKMKKKETRQLPEFVLL